MSLILGINAFHGDSAACILRGGELIAAAEEERFRRVKHWAGFPSHAIAYCLKEVGARLSDVAHVAVNQDSGANLGRKISYTLVERPQLSAVLNRLRTRRERTSIADHLARALPGEAFKGKTHAVEHHLAHLSSAFHVSPFERALAVSVDGFGDFASAAWGIGDRRSLSVDDRVYFPHSLGVFYQALTQYLGFPHYGDEYKVMGLAPYGEPRYRDLMGQIVRLHTDGSYGLDLRFFRHHSERIDYEWADGSPTFGKLYSVELEDLLGPARDPSEPLENRHRDIARSVQLMYEDAFFHLLNALHRRYDEPNLALAGGCAMNSVANGKVRQRTPFKRLYVQSAAGDAGGAIGAALCTWHELAGDEGHGLMDHAYLGPSYPQSEIDTLLRARQSEIEAQGCRLEQEAEEEKLCARVADAIGKGLVIGWFQGRMEWGPRALGNRSILCDPRRADMKDILNQKIKRRESFRPFAPSILRECVSDWFEEDDDVPFMMQVYKFRAECRERVPAVCHVDGTGRLQTVYRHTNPRYYRLIEHFQERTGVPMILNTSFNENEPVVCRPEEALDCFLRTRMDMLVMGNTVLSRKE